MDDEIRLTRCDIQTIASVDLGWIATDELTADALLRDRGRPTWLADISASFRQGDSQFGPARICESAYVSSGEHGRPTFSASFSGHYMPIEFEILNPPAGWAGCLSWSIRSLRLGPTGAISFRASAELNHQVSTVSVLDVVNAYQQFRFEIGNRLDGLVSSFLNHWSRRVPQYALDSHRAHELFEHFDFYDVVDFDFRVGTGSIPPKVLYGGANETAIKQLAGLTRMSRVMQQYSTQRARALADHDLGSRPDELWIVNTERLTRHHAEHLTDPAKQLFLTDVVLAAELIIQRRATLNYVLHWTRAMRARYLDSLTSTNDSEGSTMRELLSQVAWTTDIYVENISAERDSGTSFFRLVLRELAKAKDIAAYQEDVSRSVDNLLNVSLAVFGERASTASSDLQKAEVALARSSRNLGWAALALAVAAAGLAGVQVWLLLNPSNGQANTPVHAQHVTTTTSIAGKEAP